MATAKDFDRYALRDAMVARLRQVPFLTAKNLARTFKVPRKTVIFILCTYADNVESFYRSPLSSTKKPSVRVISVNPIDRGADEPQHS